MAEGKKSFVLYCDIKHTVEHLTDEQAGQLFKHIVAYVNDENPETDDIVIKLAFEPIKQSLKRDLLKWERYINKQSINGQLGGRPKNPSLSEKTQPFSKKPKKADSVSVSVSVSDSVNERERYTPPHDLELPELKVNSAIEYLNITKNVKSTKELVLSLWTFFKEKNFTGQKFYKSKQDTFSHFFETLKFEKIDGTHQQVLNGAKRKLGTSEGRIEGLKNW